MLDILIYFDKICVENEIEYWLTAGTLLGAIRHGGFIPWDDDIDVCVTRQDYKKLLRILPVALPNFYQLQCIEYDEDYVYHYAKIRDSRTKIIEDNPVNATFKKQGLAIDIFPMEHMSKPLCYLAAKLNNRLCYGFATKKGFGKFLYHINRFIIFNSVFPFCRLINKIIGKSQLTHVLGVNWLNERLEDTQVFPLRPIEFEGYTFMGPNKPDSYLKTFYGNYMLIPEEKTSHSSNIHIVFDNT